jgi:hypothetical protein
LTRRRHAAVVENARATNAYNLAQDIFNHNLQDFHKAYRNFQQARRRLHNASLNRRNAIQNLDAINREFDCDGFHGDEDMGGDEAGVDMTGGE